MDLHDYELGKPDEPLDIEPLPPRNRGVWLGVAAVVILGAIAVFVFYNRRPASAPAPAVAAPAAAAPTRPLGGQPEAVAVPPLDQSDAVVRDLVRGLSTHPQVLAWLTTNGLIRNFAVVVANVVEGVTPANHLRVLRPRATFQADERGSDILLDPRSYSRYDSLADAIASIDPAGASRLYATLKPRIQEAYAELGMRPASFDAALEHAFIVLLQVPIVDGPVRLEPKGIGYRYADPKLEELTGAQKQLLRMGPRNVRAVQASLRRLAVALGIPEERLP